MLVGATREYLYGGCGNIRKKRNFRVIPDNTQLPNSIPDNEKYREIKREKMPGNKGNLMVVLLLRAEILTHF